MCAFKLWAGREEEVRQGGKAPIIIFLLFIALQGAIFVAHKFTDREERNRSCAKVGKHLCCYNYPPDSINLCDTGP